jgi:putative DNA primase/helicase
MTNLFSRAAQIGLSHIEEWLPGGRREGDEYTALNPTRADKTTGSFRVNVKTGAWADFATNDKGGDAVSLYAYLNSMKQNEAARTILEKYDMSYFPGADNDERPARSTQPPDHEWQYLAQDGKLVMIVKRIDARGGQKKKIWRDPKGVKPPYSLWRLPELMTDKRPVLLVEGELKAERAQAVLADYFVTCWPGGAQSFTSVDLKPLLKKVVTCWPDNDDPGRKAMLAVARILGAPIVAVDHGAHVEGWDIADAIDDGWDAEKLSEAIEGALSPNDSVARDSRDDVDTHIRDYGHAEVLLPYFEGQFRWAVHRKAWMRYNGKSWMVIADERVAKIAADYLREEYIDRMKTASEKRDRAVVTYCMACLREASTFARIQGALNFLKGWDNVHTEADEWDKNHWLLNVSNGTLDLKTRTLQAHAANDLLTKYAPVEYRTEAKSERWDDHLAMFLPNENVRRQVQRDLGLALVGLSLEEFLALWYGIGGNGKTTTAKVIQALLGEYVIKAAPGILLETKYDRHPTEIADLAGSRIVFSVEVEKGKRLAEATVKDLTGGDKKKARYMRSDFFQFDQTFSIFLLVNDKPVITGTDEGIWRRVRLVPWSVKIPADLKRPQDEVVNELLEEGSAVLNWLLAGLADWQTDHNWCAPEVQQATDKYKQESDRLGPFFDECCEFGIRFRAPLKDVLDAYERFCISMLEEPVHKRTFSNALKAKGCVQGFTDGYKTVRCWTGMRLKQANDLPFDKAEEIMVEVGLTD